ncbi:MAG: hypothetical protein ACR2JY_04620 [Chloroflexota bacterium]
MSGRLAGARRIFITGQGGSGKSTLARQLAARILAVYHAKLAHCRRAADLAAVLRP